jgi:hypothetical protein
MFTGMSAPNTATGGSKGKLQQGELEEELWQAEADFPHGDFVELTVEQLDQCIAAGEWPWRDESSA